MIQTMILSAAMFAVLLIPTTNVLAQPNAFKDRQAVVNGNNDFAYDLYKELRENEGNLFFSPYSISTALGMTYAGARAETAEQMANTLHFPLKQKRLHPAFKQITGLLNAQGKQRPYELSVANALWGQKGFSFLPEFIKTTRQDYDAGFAELDFVNESEKARQTINKWVEGKTNDKIKDLIPKGVLNEDTRLVLTNAIYFKSAWAQEFFKAQTKQEPFLVSGKTSVKVPMMHKGEKLNYMQTDEFQLVNIPYQGQQLSMIVVLPKSEKEFSGVENSLTNANLNKWLRASKLHIVDLKLPKFKVTDEISLKKYLSKMGMPLAFSNQANFSGMTSEERVKIDEVLHKAFVDVHEKGTEAAAATAVIIAKVTAILNPKLPPRANFHADKPFMFLIRENRTGSILFMGRVNDPR